MSYRFSVLALTCLTTVAAPGAGLAEDAKHSFRATAITGRVVSVSEKSDAKVTVVCFLGAECPMARIYGPRLTKLANEFRDQGVQLIGVNSNRQDSEQDVRQYVTDLNIGFPMIRDDNNQIADQFGAIRTPEVFVLDEELQVRYHGRIDDQYAPGINRAKAERYDLKIAIEELVAGKQVSVPTTKALGCIIGKRKNHAPSSKTRVVENDITYSKHVSRVIQKHCLECHRDGEIGPFAMNNYDEVAGWADTMLETIDNGRMPPWHADPAHGKFKNTRHMPDGDKQIVKDWILGGLKEGESADLPEPIEFTDGWQLERDPDQIVEMRNRPFVVPTDGVVEYQYFVADPGFTEDKWITAAQVIPGSRAVVHHAIVFVRPPDGSRFRGIGWLSAYVPGQRVFTFPEHHARFVPAGSKLVFQMHYTPNGTKEADTTKIGLLFGDDSDITHEVITVTGIDQEFEIPPNTASHDVFAKVRRLPKHGQLLAATPHMHYRGKSFQLFGSKDDQTTLLNVPGYDFNWQHTYILEEPIPTANIEQLRFRATFDNSKGNPFNPNPEEWVTWGDQSWEEMAVAFFEVSEPREKPTDADEKKKAASKEAERTKEIDDYVATCLSKLDTDGDGRIARNETPIVVKFFSFRRMDKDKDGFVTADEIRKIAEKRL